MHAFFFLLPDLQGGMMPCHSGYYPRNAQGGVAPSEHLVSSAGAESIVATTANTSIPLLSSSTLSCCSIYAICNIHTCLRSISLTALLFMFYFARKRSSKFSFSRHKRHRGTKNTYLKILYLNILRCHQQLSLSKTPISQIFVVSLHPISSVKGTSGPLSYWYQPKCQHKRSTRQGADKQGENTVLN